MKEADANKNGGVTFDELKNYIRSLFKNGPSINNDIENQLNSLAANFNQADTDHNNEISLKGAFKCISFLVSSFPALRKNGVITIVFMAIVRTGSNISDD